MILTLIGTLLQLSLLPQWLLWITASRVFSFIDQNLVQPVLNFLFLIADWIDWCISEPVTIVFSNWKKITYVVLEFLTRPARFALVLWVHSVDWFWRIVLRTGNFCWSLFEVIFTPLKKPLQCFSELASFVLEKVLPGEVIQLVPDLKHLVFVKSGRISSVGTSEQLKESSDPKRGRGKKSATMMSVVGGQTVAKKLTKVTVGDPEPDDKREGMVADYTASVVYAACHTVFEYLSGDEGSKALGKLLEVYGVIGQELAKTEDAKKAFNAQGHSSVLGTYDAAEVKMNDLTSKCPAAVKSCVIPLLVCYAALFCSGLLFTLIRFSLYGLH
ncbi:hypothetical protein R1flu_015872 [Riccia fluitans]|uniref:Uncharacterized protein n=1 Tax=Riccia fluitans TaxID=41844 RepID=A0ABD1YK74_9MARC